MSTHEDFDMWIEGQLRDGNPYPDLLEAWQGASGQRDAEIAQLKAEVERTQSHLVHTIESRDATFRANESLKAEIAQLKAERDALLKDAERYRWLRGQHEGHEDMEFDADGLPMPIEPTALAWTVFRPENESLEPVGCIVGELDAAIDEAMASSSKGGK